MNAKLRNHSAQRLRDRGFTLVELMISIAVISILAGMAAQTFRVVLDAREIAMRRIEINETGRSALDYIATDLRSAYLTPDSVKPFYSYEQSTVNVIQGPRFRFAGIHRDVIADPDEGCPGAGKDDDGDGLVDEEVLDGIDGDYSGGAADALSGSSRPQTDPLGCEAGDSACIDEDIGLFPSDILHFVSAVENSGDLILQEISYGLDPSGTKLIRRAQILKIRSGNSSGTDKIYDFGQFVDDSSGKALLPTAAPVDRPVVSSSDLQKAIENWDFGSKYGQLVSESNNYTNKNPAKLFQVLAYDVRGLRFRYWYYDYNRGGWRYSEEWDSTRETALLFPSTNVNGKIFNMPAASNSTENRQGKMSFENIIVNEPDDRYPLGPNNRFLPIMPQQLRPAQNNTSVYADVSDRIVQKTDGLPNMVDITIYVQDREHKTNPKPFTTRVFIPNNYRSVGI